MHIWDTVIQCAYPEPFIVNLDIDANGTTLHTAYGVVKMDSQDMKLFIEMCRKADMTLMRKMVNNDQFYLLFRKSR